MRRYGTTSGKGCATSATSMDRASQSNILEEWRAVGPTLGVTLLFVEVGSSNQFDSAFAAMMRERPDAFIMTADPFHLSHIGWIIDFLARNRLPAMYVMKENVAAGGLMAYGPSLTDLYRRAAGYVHKILQGTKPADLPVEQPVTFELVLGITNRCQRPNCSYVTQMTRHFTAAPESPICESGY